MTKLRFIKSIRKDLGLLFILAISIIFLIDFWLINIPELFNGGFKFGQIVYKLSMSYISAFIFYFLVVHIKQQKDKQNLHSYLIQKVYKIIGSALALISEISKESGVILATTYPSEEELGKICKSINPNKNAPLLLGRLGNYANWMQYFENQRKRSDDATEKIFKKMPFLETELVSILSKIEDSGYFMYLKNIGNTKINSQDITFLQSSISTYLELIKELEKYAEKTLKKYK